MHAESCMHAIYTHQRYAESTRSPRSGQGPGSATLESPCRHCESPPVRSRLLARPPGVGTGAVAYHLVFQKSGLKANARPNPQGASQCGPAAWACEDLRLELGMSEAQARMSTCLICFCEGFRRRTTLTAMQAASGSIYLRTSGLHSTAVDSTPNARTKGWANADRIDNMHAPPFHRLRRDPRCELRRVCQDSTERGFTRAPQALR